MKHYIFQVMRNLVDTKESMDQSTEKSLQSGSPTVISLLDHLRSPTPVDLSRKRHLRQNPPPKGVKITYLCV